MAIYRLAAPGEVAVRIAGGSDAAALAALRAEWSTGSADVDAAFVDQFESWLRAEHDRRITWVGEVDGAVVGMLNLTVFRRMPKPRRRDGAPGSSWAYVSTVYVTPARRGWPRHAARGRSGALRPRTRHDPAGAQPFGHGGAVVRTGRFRVRVGTHDA
jgi:hypothetical protein